MITEAAARSSIKIIIGIVTQADTPFFDGVGAKSFLDLFKRGIDFGVVGSLADGLIASNAKCGQDSDNNNDDKQLDKRESGYAFHTT